MIAPRIYDVVNGFLFLLQGKNGSLGNGYDGDKPENGREDGKIHYTFPFDLC